MPKITIEITQSTMNRLSKHWDDVYSIPHGLLATDDYLINHILNKLEKYQKREKGELNSVNDIVEAGLNINRNKR